MTELDDLISALGGDATYAAGAAERLEQQLAAEKAPRAIGRRRRWTAAVAFAVAASIGGGGVGAVIEMQQTRLASPLLPAGQSGTVASLLMGEG